MPGWKLSDRVLPHAVYAPTLWCASGRLFVSGGATGGSDDRQIYASKINTDGSLGAWVNVGVLPHAFYSPGVYVDEPAHVAYMYGGFTGNSFFGRVKHGSDGTAIYSGSEEGASSFSGQATCLARIGNYLYASNGENTPNTALTYQVHRASINGTGPTGKWLPTIKARGDLADGAIASSNGVLIAIHQLNAPAGAGFGTTSIPLWIDYAIPGTDGEIRSWTILGKLGARAGCGVVGTDAGVFVIGGYSTPDGVSYAEYSDVWLIPVGKDKKVSAPTQLPPVNVARDTMGVATDGRFVFAAGGEDVNGIRLSSIEVFDLTEIR